MFNLKKNEENEVELNLIQEKKNSTNLAAESGKRSSFN